MDANADHTKFPPSWLFHRRWGKGKKDAAKGVSFTVVGGRTTAFVPKIQGRGPSARSGEGRAAGARSTQASGKSEGATKAATKSPGAARRVTRGARTTATRRLKHSATTPAAPAGRVKREPAATPVPQRSKRPTPRAPRTAPVKRQRITRSMTAVGKLH